MAGSSGSLVSSPLRSALLRTTARFHHSKSERGSLAFPACPPWSWRFHAGPTRVSPDSSDHGRNRSRGPHDLRLFVRDTSQFVRPLLCSPPAGKPARGERGSSHGVFQRFLSTSISVPRPHRIFVAEDTVPGGCPPIVAKLPDSARDPPLPFLPASTVYSV